MKWRTLLITLTAVLALLVLAGQVLAFTDVSSEHPYSTAISDLSSRGIISGYADDTFRPETTVKRAQFAKMIVGTLGLAPTLHEGMSSPFTDLGADSQSSLYPHQYIAAAYANNITKGMSEHSYGPYVEISRAQVITMVVRAAESMHPGSLNDPPGSYSSSWGNFSHTHGANAEMAEYNGLLGGLPLNGSASDPWASMPRGEVAQVLHNYLSISEGGSPATTTTTTEPAATGTRENPLPLGASAVIGDWEVTVDNVILNANDVVAEENQFNDPPAAGNQYVIVGITGKYVGEDSGRLWLDMSYNFYGDAGKLFKEATVVIPSDLAYEPEGFPGASVSGNLAFEVSSDQVAGGVLVVAGSWSMDSEQRVFFALQ